MPYLDGLLIKRGMGMKVRHYYMPYHQMRGIK